MKLSVGDDLEGTVIERLPRTRRATEQRKVVGATTQCKRQHSEPEGAIVASLLGSGRWFHLRVCATAQDTARRAPALGASAWSRLGPEALRLANGEGHGTQRLAVQACESALWRRRLGAVRSRLPFAEPREARHDAGLQWITIREGGSPEWIPRSAGPGPKKRKFPWLFRQTWRSPPGSWASGRPRGQFCVLSSSSAGGEARLDRGPKGKQATKTRNRLRPWNSPEAAPFKLVACHAREHPRHGVPRVLSVPDPSEKRGVPGLEGDPDTRPSDRRKSPPEPDRPLTGLYLDLRL